MRKNPNATVAAGGTGVGVLAVWLAGYLGVDLSPEAGAAIAGAVATVALAVGRDGVRGLARRVWRGTNQLG